jgi:MFS family permease
MNDTDRRRNMILVGLIGFSYFFAFSQFVMLPLFLQPFGLSAGEIGVMLSWLFFASMASRPVIGVVMARIGPRRLAVFWSLVWILTTPLFLLIDEQTTWLMYPLRVVQGLGVASIDLVVMLIPQRLSPPHKRAQGLGIVSVFFVLGWSVSPVVAEWLLTWSGFDAVFLLSTASGVISLVGALLLRLPAEARPEQPFRMSLAGNWRRTFNRPMVLLLLATFIGLGFPLAAYDNFIPLYARSLAIGAGSAFFLARSVTSILARAFLSGLSDRWGRTRVVAPALALGIGVQLTLFWTDSVALLVVAGLLHGLQGGLQMPAIMAHVFETQGEVADPALGIGLFFMAFDGGFWVGAMSFGFIAESIGFGPAYLTLMACMVCAIGLVLLVREPPRPRAAA